MPMLMVPASLIFAGSLATRAGSTVGALAEVVADVALELLLDSESEPQAVRASAVVATAATARARLRNMWVLSRGCTERRGRHGAVYGADPATGSRRARHTPVTISLCDDAHPRPPPRAANGGEAPPSAPRTARPPPRAAGPPRISFQELPHGRVAPRPLLRPEQPGVPGPRGREAGGTPDAAAARPGGPRPALHPRRRRGLARDRCRPEPVDPLHRAGEHRGRHQRRHRGARSGRHRPARGDAGDGGQGGAVQALRRHRRRAGGAWRPAPSRSS